eukprot:gene11426-15311_t
MYSVTEIENGEWRINSNAITLVSNFVEYKTTAANLIMKNPSCRGEYLVVDSSDSKFWHRTEDSALRGLDGPFSFVGFIKIIVDFITKALGDDLDLEE